MAEEKAAASLTLARVGSALAAVSVAAQVTVAVLGPSAATPSVSGPGPTRSLGLHPAALTVTVGLWLAVGTAAAAVICWWAALRHGWLPSVRRVVGWGVLAAVVLAGVPPLASADVLAYGMYGRIARLGLDPYTTDIDDLPAMGDPVGLAYTGGWTESVSVYGPVSVTVMGAASTLSGESLAWFVLVMQLVALAAFLATGWLLLQEAGPDPPARVRVAVLWLANPLLVYLMVNPAHIDALAVALGVAGLLLLRRSAALAGVMAALAVGTKVTYALYLVAMVWALRRDRSSLGRLLLTGALTGGLLFVPVLPQVLGPLRTAAGYVASESPWHFLQLAAAGLGVTPSPRLLSALAWLLMAFLVWRLRPLVPRRRSAASQVDDAVWAAVLLSAGWLLSATYALPWYDVIVWAPLLLLPAAPFDLLMLTRSAAIALAYLPGVVLHPRGAAGLVAGALRGLTAPVVSVGLATVGLVAPQRWRSSPRELPPA